MAHRPYNTQAAKIKDIQKKYDKEIRAEIAFRGLNNENLKFYGELTMIKRKDLLGIDRRKILAAKLKGCGGIKPSDVLYMYCTEI